MTTNKFLNKIPLVQACFGIIAGIAWQNSFPLGINILLTCLILSLTIVCKLISKYNLKWCNLLLFFFMGALVLALSNAKHQRLRDVIKDARKIYGIVHNIESKRSGWLKNKVIVQIINIMGQSNKLDTWHTYYINVYCQTCKLSVGDYVVISAKITPPPKESSFRNKLSWHHYLAKENILGFAFCKKPWEIKKARFTQETMRKSILRMRESIRRKIEAKLTQNTYKLFASIFLGIRNVINEGLTREYFARWGISHYLARSGLHIAIYTSIWLSILSMLFVPIIFRYAMLLLLILIYYVFSWTSVSFLRAHWVFTLVAIGRTGSNPTTPCHLLSLVCLILLLFNPHQLFALDFQLSFALSLALSILLPILQRKHDKSTS